MRLVVGAFSLRPFTLSSQLLAGKPWEERKEEAFRVNAVKNYGEGRPAF